MYRIQTIKLEEAKKIVKWRYESPYSFYNMDQDEESIKELMDGSYFSVYNQEQRLVGYFCYGKNAQVPGGVKAKVYSDGDLIDIGLGLRPDLTGKGNGFEFLNVGLDFWKQNYDSKGFRLSVATFNKRAISLYKKAGFIPKDIFLNKRGKNIVEFLVMEKTSERSELF